MSKTKGAIEKELKAKIIKEIDLSIEERECVSSSLDLVIIGLKEARGIVERTTIIIPPTKPNPESRTQMRKAFYREVIAPQLKRENLDNFIQEKKEKQFVREETKKILDSFFGMFKF